MGLVVTGLLNKQVGGELGISEITVNAHRGNVMRKMKAGSFADLVNMAAKFGLGPAPKVDTPATRRSPLVLLSSLLSTPRTLVVAHRRVEDPQP